MDITKNTYDEIKTEIISYIKQYYPDVVDDFSDANIMTMIVEMLSYVGDTLHYQQQMEFSKLFIRDNYDKESLLKLAMLYGFRKFKRSAATTTVTISVTVPANLNNPPDGKLNEDYLKFIVQEGTEFESATNPPVRFRLLEDVDFGNKLSQNYKVVSNLNFSGIIQSYTVSKTAKVIAATYKSYVHTVENTKSYYSITLPDNNIIGIESVFDVTADESWYETNSFLQNSIFTIAKDGDNEYHLYSLTSHNLYMVHDDMNTNTTKIIFGGGNDSTNHNMDDYLKKFGEQWLSANSDFYIKDIYGEMPVNEHLFSVNYYTSNGKAASVPPNTISSIKKLLLYKDSSATSNLFSVITEDLFGVTNAKSAVGAVNDLSVEFLQNNLEGFFSTQNRAVTLEDYRNIVSSFPSKLGYIAKQFCMSKNSQIYLWLLTVDGNNRFVELSDYMKENLLLWITKYRMIGDIVNVMTPKVINISVDVTATVNKRKVELHTDTIRNNIKKNILDFISPEKVQINQEIDLWALSQYIYDNNQEIRSIDKLTINQNDPSVNMAVREESKIVQMDTPVPYIFQLIDETDENGKTTININLIVK